MSIKKVHRFKMAVPFHDREYGGLRKARYTDSGGLITAERNTSMSVIGSNTDLQLRKCGLQLMDSGLSRALFAVSRRGAV